MHISLNKLYLLCLLRGVKAIKVASSSTGDIQEVLKNINQPDIQLIIYYYSINLKSRELHKTIQEKYPHIKSMGCTMIGGWSDKGAIDNGIVAMSLSDNEVENVVISFQSGVKSDPAEAAKKIIADISQQIDLQEINPIDYYGIILFDGLCLGEIIMRELTVSKKFTVPIIGGAAADDLTFTETLVSAGNQVSSDAVALMIVKSKVPFYYNHYVHYEPTGSDFIISNATPDKRIVWEIEGKPAADFYAKLLGLNRVEDINNSSFSNNPLGVVIGEAVYTRSPNSIIDGKGIQFYCSIEAGTKMHLLKKTNIIEQYLEKIEGGMLFNCVLRYLEMKQENNLKQFAEVFDDIPFIGFNTYGEELFTHHNQTLTALFLGSHL